MVAGRGPSRDGRRALNLLNLDLERSHPVVLQLDGAPAGGKALACWLTADRVDANNEPDNPRTPEPEVALHEEQLAGFGPDYRLTLPAHSMCVLQWELLS